MMKHHMLLFIVLFSPMTTIDRLVLLVPILVSLLLPLLALLNLTIIDLAIMDLLILVLIVVSLKSLLQVVQIPPLHPVVVSL